MLIEVCNLSVDDGYCFIQTDGQMKDQQMLGTNRWLEGMFDDNKPLMLDSDTA